MDFVIYGNEIWSLHSVIYLMMIASPEQNKMCDFQYGGLILKADQSILICLGIFSYLYSTYVTSHISVMILSYCCTVEFSIEFSRRKRQPWQ